MTRRSLLRDTRGAAFTEFAFVAPVMILLFMGLGDMSYQLYAKSLLNGAIQKAARDSAIQGGAQQAGALDAKVIAVVSTLMKAPTQSCATTPAASTWCSTRRSYASFAQVGPEPFTDANADGIRQSNECYSDVNGNKQWDADPGATYPRIFPAAKLFGWTQNVTISQTTLLKNQPYATQTVVTPATICS